MLPHATEGAPGRAASQPRGGTMARPNDPPGEGLPADPVRQDSPGARPADEGPVLFADDHDAVRRTGRALLESLGFRVVLASDGLQAVELFRERQRSGEPLAAVILDLCMPTIDGPEAARRILEAAPDARVVVMSGYPRWEVEQRLEGVRVSGVLPKPFRPEELREALRRALG